MQLKKIKENSNPNDTLSKISSFKKETTIKKNIIIFSLTGVLLIVFIISIFLFIKLIKELPIKSFKEKEDENFLLKMAEESYKNGFLENSATYYQNYLKTNPSIKDKIVTYKRLFEIKILSNEIVEALYYLDKWEELKPDDPLIHISRLKILLRENRFIEAKRVIDKNYNKLKKSTEFKELTAIYFIKLEKYEYGLKELLKIPFDKREIPHHNKIVNCYLKLNQITNALAYINKIEPKLRNLENKDYLMEFAMLKAITLMLKGDFDSANIELKPVILYKKFKEASLKLSVYCNIFTDTLKEVEETLEEEKEALYKDPKFLRILGDYFYFKNKYEKAIEVYERIIELKDLDISEKLTLADIYFNANRYEDAIKVIEKIYNENKFESPNLYKNLSICYNKLNNSENEFFYLKEGANKYKDDIDFNMRIAKYYFDRKDYNEVISYINNINKNDKRLENLKILSLYLSKDKLTEKELLIIREKEKETPEYYFKLIEFYLKNKKYSDAKREIDTINTLILSPEQKNILNMYSMIWALGINNEIEYNKAKDQFLNSTSSDIVSNINKILIYIRDNELNKANDLLSGIDISNIDRFYQEKIYFLKAVILYYNRDFIMAYKFLQKSLEINPYNKKALFLKNVITGIKQF